MGDQRKIRSDTNFVRRFAWVIVGLLVLLGLTAFVRVRLEQPSPERPAVLAPASALSFPPATVTSAVQVIAEGLEVPWALAFAPARNASRGDTGGPDGTLYVSERGGRVVRLRDGNIEWSAAVPGVVETGEGGLLGLALDPAFAENNLLYVYFTSQDEGIQNRVVRFRVTERGLEQDRILIDEIPGARFHDGGRIAFGPDGLLYITTGDATEPTLAPRRDSLAGKILRIRPDGSIPSDNPFPGSPVYTLGHRNPQGLAWTDEGTLYATEHGPSDVPPNCCHDEVNRIAAGKDYGWPQRAGRVRGPAGTGSRGASVDPVVESGSAVTWAPGGAAVIGGSLYFGGLRGEALYALDLQAPTGVRELFKGEFGRIRDVVRGPDGALYLTTSNRDGRGTPRPGDDKILRVDPEVLTE